MISKVGGVSGVRVVVGGGTGVGRVMIRCGV